MGINGNYMFKENKAPPSVPLNRRMRESRSERAHFSCLYQTQIGRRYKIIDKQREYQIHPTYQQQENDTKCA